MEMVVLAETVDQAEADPTTMELGEPRHLLDKGTMEARGDPMAQRMRAAAAGELAQQEVLERKPLLVMAVRD
jgi:hypothetical protein